MIPVPATIVEFEAFLNTYGTPAFDAGVTVSYTVGSLSVPVDGMQSALNLSAVMLGAIEFCVEGDTVTGQCFIAVEIANGTFDPMAISDGKHLVKSGLGRNAIVDEWDIDAELSGTDALSMLKRMPMAYNALKPLLCKGADGGVTNFELIR